MYIGGANLLISNSNAMGIVKIRGVRKYNVSTNKKPSFEIKY